MFLMWKLYLKTYEAERPVEKGAFETRDKAIRYVEENGEAIVLRAARNAGLVIKDSSRYYERVDDEDDLVIYEGRFGDLVILIEFEPIDPTQISS